MIESITVRPSTTAKSEYAIVEFHGVRILTNRADIDGSDNLTFYRNNQSITHVKVEGVPLEVPNMIRRAIKYGERSEWP